MLHYVYFLAKIGADTAENEQHFAEFLPKTGNYPTGRATAPRASCAALRSAAAGGLRWHYFACSTRKSLLAVILLFHHAQNET